MGTYLLFSPEMFGKEKVLGEKSDIWALGMTFYFLIVGYYPWKDAKNPLQLRDMVINDEIDFRPIKNP